jgi:hypothetical protein
MLCDSIKNVSWIEENIEIDEYDQGFGLLNKIKIIS